LVHAEEKHPYNKVFFYRDQVMRNHIKNPKALEIFGNTIEKTVSIPILLHHQGTGQVFLFHGIGKRIQQTFRIGKQLCRIFSFISSQRTLRLLYPGL